MTRSIIGEEGGNDGENRCIGRWERSSLVRSVGARLCSIGEPRDHGTTPKCIPKRLTNKLVKVRYYLPSFSPSPSSHSTGGRLGTREKRSTTNQIFTLDQISLLLDCIIWLIWLLDYYHWSTLFIQAGILLVKKFLFWNLALSLVSSWWCGSTGPES